MGNTVTDATVSAFYDTMLANAAISGLDIELHWDFAEPNPPPSGTLTAADLSLNYINDAFTEAAKYGKTIKLEVTAGFNSPQWLLDHTQPTGLPSCDTLFTTGNASNNCGTVTFNYYGESTDQDTPNQTNQMLVLPLPWNSTYIADWQALLTVLQQQYGSNPTLVGVTMAGPTAASPEMIMPNNYNTCANPTANGPPPNQGPGGVCYTCPKGTDPPCNPGMLAEAMWNTLFQNPKSNPGTPYPQNSDQAFVAQWINTINFYESTFLGITLTITPGTGTGFPSFGSGYPFTPTTGNVLYDPECSYSNTGGSTYANNNYATRSCDAATYLLSYFMNTAGGPGMDGMASQTSGMEAQDATELGNFGDGNTGDVGVPGVKYLAAYSLSAGSSRQQVIGGAQFDHQVSDPAFTAEVGCPTGKNGCPGITPEQAEYNVMQVFFLGTPGAIRFGGAAIVGSTPAPTPRYLEVLNQDITYAALPTSVAQPITDVMTGDTYQLSAQDMLNMAKASLFGRLPAHDFNEDGRSDIIWRDTSGDVAMWLMNGPAVSQSAGVGNAPAIWSIVGQRDFNADGKADILWHNTSGNVAIWFMNGPQVSQSVGIGNAPMTWSIVGTGDFFGNGNGGILWRDTSGDVAIWELSGSTIVQSCGVGTAPTTWSIAGTGDFNGDGNTDILWHDTAGDVAIWEMNGCSVLQSAGVGTVNPSVWSIAGTGDFNGDGKTDILWHDTSGDVAIWEMNGAAILQSSGVGTANPSVWSIAQTGDYNADGMSDILWRDTSGDVAVWQMNGATITQSAYVGTAPTVWSIQDAGAD